MLEHGKKTKKNGFTLVECVIAMVVSLVGLLAIYSLVVMSVRTQTVARELGIANSFSRAKIEELKNSTRTPGGSLTSNTNGYFDSPTTRYTRRWQISNDSMGTQTVTVAIIPSQAGALLPEATMITRMK